MDKIYGYREEDVKGLAEFIAGRGNAPLSKVFEAYAKKCGKAKGTVRNLYYAVAKLSREDKAFCDKYLGGKPIAVSKIVEFGEEEERTLIKKILSFKREGRSIRSAIMELAGGDGKLALRYQNKFRNQLKTNPELIERTAKEINASGVRLSKRPAQTAFDFPAAQIERLKKEIDGLAERIALKEKRENAVLLARIRFLEEENARLSDNETGKVSGIKYFGAKGANPHSEKNMP